MPFILLLIAQWLVMFRPASEDAEISRLPGVKMKGLSFVAPRDSFRSDPITPILQCGADWIAVIPYAFHSREEQQVRYDDRPRWWGERREGVRATIALAHQAGIRTMLKPQVWAPGSWPGDIQFAQDSSWQRWEASYSAYILPLAALAQEMQTELFCIGTEFRHSVRQRPDYWRQLIRQVRAVYTGKIVYAANWDDYMDAPFWNELDYIGVNAYFPLSEKPQPAKEELLAAWAPQKEKLRQFSKRWRKPILFTEFGYLSVEGCAGKTWELEKQLPTLTENQKAQATAIDAVFEAFGKESFWAGGFLWKWYPQYQPGNLRFQKDYTPQGKLAEQTLKYWFTGK